MTTLHVKQFYVTYAYHFMSEAIIIYLVLLPFSYSYYENVSMWSYLGITIGVALVYSFVSKYIKNYAPYLTSLPFLLLLFYFVGYPLLVSIIFSGLFVWRYIAIRSNAFIGNEATYVGATILLSLLGLFITRNFEVINFLIVQIAIVLLGYILSHLFVIEMEKRRAINRSEWFKWGSFFAIVIGAVYMLSDLLTTMAASLWSGLGNVLTILVGGIARFFEFLGLSAFFNKGINEMEPIEIGGFEEEEAGEMPVFEQHEGISMDIIMFVLLGIIIIAFVIILYKAIKERAKDVEHDEALGFEIREEALAGYKSSSNKGKRKKGKKPGNPIRRLVYDFEKKAAKLDLARLHHESIENWFQRIGLEADLQVYQKVRYGDLNTSAEEEQELKETLKRFAQYLETHKENELEKE